MTDTRQVLEEAWNVIHPFNDPASDCSFPKACRKCDRFRRFLDAEAWTDAAMMLVDQRAKSSALRTAWSDVSEKLALHIRFMRDDVDYSAEIALALAQACLKARENADG